MRLFDDAYVTLRLEHLEHGILMVSFNRPQRLNAIDGRMHAELARIFHDIAEDEAIRVVILTGAGRAFSAGGDMEWLGSISNVEEYAQVLQHGRQIIERLLEVPQPVIAMVNGPAMGLGCTIALFCDFVYAADNAQLGDPHIRVGVVAGDGGALAWPLLVGHLRAKAHLLTGDPVDAGEAVRIGLINEAVPAAELEARVMSMALRLAQGPQLAQRYTKWSVNRWLKQMVQQNLDASLALEGLTFFTRDRHEGVQSIKEKRRPQFGDR